MLGTDERGRHQDAVVISNGQVCREHHRLTLGLERFAPAAPGQFVHISPVSSTAADYRDADWSKHAVSDAWWTYCSDPFLRRAFSIAVLGGGNERHKLTIDLIYRVVGKATRWMAARRPGERISVLGPLGNRFPISKAKPLAWMVAGGVGLPPMMWLAKSLASAGKRQVAFCGAQTRDLLALTMRESVKPTADAIVATLCAKEFAVYDTPVIISTDDGSLGFRGHVGQALQVFHAASDLAPDDVVVYTCGPERMMRFVANFCQTHGIECHVCMERAMACGTGMCQSCVVPVRDPTDPEGWRYRLCCVDGPVFRSEDILWDE